MSWSSAGERVRQLCVADSDERAMRSDILHTIASVIPFDYYVWALTDPVTEVGASPLAYVPSLGDLSRVIRSKYLTDLNRWTALSPDRVVTLVDATGGYRAASLLWREVLSGYGVQDVASAVLRDRFGTWAFLDLWRSTGRPFTSSETEFLASLLPFLTAAVRTRVAASFVPDTNRVRTGPIVILLTGQLVPRQQTLDTDARLRALLPTPADRRPVPALALNVAAQLLALEAGTDTHPPSARLAATPGQWVTANAARLGSHGGDRSSIAVTITRSTTMERAEIYARALGLTTRQTEVLGQLLNGADTRTVARTFGIADHTVNDHVKAIVAKSGTQSRRQVIANATG